MRGEREHVVIHLHPKTIRTINHFMKRLQYSNIEEFIIDAVALKLLLLEKRGE